jgi:hypothetical protein
VKDSNSVAYLNNRGHRHPDTIADEIDSARAEIEAIRMLSEYDVCCQYNVDDSEEIISMIREDIYSLESEYEDAVYREAEINGVDAEDWLNDYGDKRYLN